MMMSLGYVTFLLFIVSTRAATANHAAKRSIQDDIYEGLKPVRELESRLKIKFGNDGTTIVTYHPSGKTLIVDGDRLYECRSKISDLNGACSGTIYPFVFRKDADFCYANSYSIINDVYCFGDGETTAGYHNGKAFCTSKDNTPTLQITKDEYFTLCTPLTKTASFKYFTNTPLEDVGADVHCTDTIPQMCILVEDIGSFGHF